MVLVSVDTTAFEESPNLDRFGWPELLAWSRRDLLEVVVSEVVLLEADRHVRRRARKEFEVLASSASSMAELAEIQKLDIGRLQTQSATAAEARIQARRDRLADAGVTTLPLPAVSHAELLARDLGERKPFRPSGKGYRDALMWESLLEHLDSIWSEDVVLITNDNDFGSHAKDVELAPELRTEAEARGHTIRRVVSLPDLVNSLRPELSKQAEEADALLAMEDEGPSLRDQVGATVASSVERLDGEPLVDDDGDDLGAPPELAALVPDDVVSAFIAGVHVDAASVSIDVYDDSNDALLMHVEVDAIVDIEGRRLVHPMSPYESASEGPDDIEIDDEVMVEREARFTYYVTVIGTSIEDVQLDSIEPL